MGHYFLDILYTHSIAMKKDFLYILYKRISEYILTEQYEEDLKSVHFYLLRPLSNCACTRVRARLYCASTHGKPAFKQTCWVADSTTASVVGPAFVLPFSGNGPLKKELNFLRLPLSQISFNTFEVTKMYRYLRHCVAYCWSGAAIFRETNGCRLN